MSGASRKPNRSMLLAALVAAALPLACGYSSGLRVAERYSSVGLEIFGNDSFERDLERQFHDEMSRSLRDLSDARLVESDDAKAVLRGKIHVYQRRAGIRSRQNVRLETGVRIEVEASLYVRGKDLPERGPVRAAAAVGYTLDDPDNENDARERALRHIADELVLALLAPPE